MLPESGGGAYVMDRVFDLVIAICNVISLMNNIHNKK